jgi:GNAT superfamily N-acetyltransferase
MAKFNEEDVKIERMTDKHKIDCFKSYESELVNFLVEDALENQKNKISVTYLWFLKESGQLVGYITLLSDRINLEGDLKQTFRDKGIEYHSLPALKVGRLCVDDSFLRKGLGTLMLAFAVKVAHHIFNNYAGCRFIVLDAKRSPQNDPIHFYKKVGFIALKERKKGSTPMYLDLINNVKSSI